MDGPRLESWQGQHFFSSPKRSDKLWGTHILLCNWFSNPPPPRRQLGRGVMLTTHLHLVPRLIMSATILLFPLYALMVWTGQLHIFVSERSMTYAHKGTSAHTGSGKLGDAGPHSVTSTAQTQAHTVSPVRHVQSLLFNHVE